MRGCLRFFARFFDSDTARGSTRVSLASQECFVEYEMPKPVIGSRIQIDGVDFEIVEVAPFFTPFRRQNQETFVAGYTVGLKEIVVERTTK